jgi:hypothetical protein
MNVTKVLPGMLAIHRNYMLNDHRIKITICGSGKKNVLKKQLICFLRTLR